MRFYLEKRANSGFGFQVCQGGGGTFIVTDVIPGSVADVAGIQYLDSIVSVGTYDMRKMTLRKLCRILGTYNAILLHVVRQQNQTDGTCHVSINGGDPSCNATRMLVSPREVVRRFHPEGRRMLILAVLSTLICFTPTSVVALIKASMARAYFLRGDIKLGIKSKEEAPCWIIISIILGLPLLAWFGWTMYIGVAYAISGIYSLLHPYRG